MLTTTNSLSIRDEKINEIDLRLRSMRDSNEVIDMFLDVLRELSSATSKFGKFNSCHEGAAVFLEEVDELWDHVKVKQSQRDIPAMRKEAVQCAAMAVRFGVDCCNEVDGRR